MHIDWLSRHSARQLRAFADESGLMMSPLVRRTWAPIGRTPVIRRKARAHQKITAIAAVCSRSSGRSPWMYFRLLAHRAKKVAQFVAKHARLELVLLPPYAPELNPVEYAWGHLKTNGLANFAPRTTDELHDKAKREVCRIRTSRDLLRSFLRHSPLKFGARTKLCRRQ